MGRTGGALGPDDMIAVAPYNSQAELLAARPRGIRVGTIDRFHG